MSMILSEKQKELRPNIALYIMSFLAITAVSEMVLIYSYDSIMDMRIMIPFFIIIGVVLAGHIAVYIMKNRKFISHMNNVIESLPLSRDQKGFLVRELQVKSKGINSQDDISKKLHSLTSKIKKDDNLTETEIEVINKIVFGHYPIRPTIENNLNQ